MKRNYAIDFFRGLIAIHVILIHTVFHSGNNYVPLNVSCLTLLFDIPIFMLLSGMTFSFSNSPKKKMKEIFNLLFKWGIFVIGCFVYLLIVDKDAIVYKDFISWLVFKPATKSIWTISISASLSFLIFYIQTTVICSIIIYFVKKYSKDDFYENLLYVLGFLIFGFLSVNYNLNFFGLLPVFIAYCIFFLVGYLSMHYKFKNIIHLLVLEVLLFLIVFILFKVNDYSISNLQELKSKMNYLYVLVSFISIFVVIYLKDRFKFEHKIWKPIIFVGKNAIYSFFAQGISSSIMYKIVPLINVNNLYFKILICFIINLFIAMVIFIILYYVYKLIYICIRKLNLNIPFIK